MTKVQIIEAKLGGYSALVNFFDYEVQLDRKIYLCSRMNPLKEGIDWANHTYSLEKKHFIIYGMGLGYHIKAMLDKLQEDQYLYVIDSNKEVYQACLPYIGEEILAHKQLKVLLTEEPIKIKTLLSEIPIEYSQFVAYLPCVQLIPRSLTNIRQMVEKQILKKNTHQKHGDSISKHYQINSQNNYLNVSQFFDQHKNHPMILVSAGPSLDRSIDMLKQVSKDTIIFATGRVLKLLLKKQVRVDYFCIIDSSDEITVKQVEGLEKLDIPFVFLNTVGPKTIEAYKGPKYMAYSMDSPLQQEGRIETGGSVATAALDLGIKFGCNPIIFVGQDLAYTQLLTHCQGVEDTGVTRKVSSQTKYMKKVKGIDGNYLPTTVPLLNFKKWIEDEIRKYPEVEFINATASGAYIEGCRHQSLEKTLTEIKSK